MGGIINNLPISGGPMARRRSSRMFKQISNVHLETVADSDWSSFLKIEKQQDGITSAYIDKVRISYVVAEEENEVAQGMLFVASHDNALDSTTPGNNDGQILAASASRGGGGVCTLNIKKRVTINYDGASADTLELLQGAAGPIYLHAYSAEIGEQTQVYLVIETWGRWFSATSL